MSQIFPVILCIFLTLSVSGAGWGADYTFYVDGNCSGESCDTAPYDTPGKAAPHPRRITEYIKSNFNAGDTKTIYIAAGIYTGSNSVLNFDGAELEDTTVVGAGRDVVTLDRNGDSHQIYASGACSNVTMSGLTAMGNGTNHALHMAANADNFSFTEVGFESKDNHTVSLIYLIDNEGFLFDRCLMRYKDVGSSYAVYTRNGSAGTFRYCVSEASIYGPSSAWCLTGSGVHNIYNCIIKDSCKDTVELANGTLISGIVF